jgi:YebC/PmpR family DNA-binding regulatory protein
MAGHSKWANIQHRKGAQDAKRGKLFTKLIRELTTAARQGGSDPDANPRLRAAIDKALSNNMTRETIDKAIKRGAGELELENVEELRYEGYASGGVALLIDCITDNRNRTISELRPVFRKNEATLGTEGSVAYLFSKQGVLLYAPGVSEEFLLEAALEAGAEDVITHEDKSIEVSTSPDNFGRVKDALTAKGFESVHAEVSMASSVQVAIEDPMVAAQLHKLIDALEELDDVQEVYTNADFRC